MTEPDCKGTCMYHEDRDKLMARIKDTVSQHKGYWRVLLVVLVVALGAMFNMTKDIKDSMATLTKDMKQSVKSISTDVSELKRVVSIGNVQHNYNETRLDNQKSFLRDIDNRVRYIEIETGRDEGAR